MAHSFHHVHLKAKDPRQSAKWWVEVFEAKQTGERELRGSLMLNLQLGSTTVNISSPRPGDNLNAGSSDLCFGLEHIAVSTDNLDADLAKLKQRGAKVFEQMTTPTGGKIAFIEGPDNVRIELMQV